jgi:plasmid stability protein
MSKLIVELPDEIHGELKRKAAINNKSLKEIVTSLIRKYLSGEQKIAESKKGSDLCGRWEDERSAEQIIKDIKAHRHWFRRNN